VDLKRNLHQNQKLRHWVPFYAKSRPTVRNLRSKWERMQELQPCTLVTIFRNENEPTEASHSVRCHRSQQRRFISFFKLLSYKTIAPYFLPLLMYFSALFFTRSLNWNNYLFFFHFNLQSCRYQPFGKIFFFINHLSECLGF